VWLGLASSPEVVEKLAEPALGVVAQTALGAITLVMTAVAVFAVYKVIAVQDKRAADAKESSERIEKIIDKITEFQTETRRTIDSLVLAENAAKDLSREQTTMLTQIKQTLDTTIRDAILRRHTPTPGPGGYSGPTRRT
jgi:uncharacterized protein YlxW (UPF0749 family)